jgi:hypothetical protein
MTNNKVKAPIGIVQKITYDLEQLYQKTLYQGCFNHAYLQYHFFDKHSNKLKNKNPAK